MSPLQLLECNYRGINCALIYHAKVNHILTQMKLDALLHFYVYINYLCINCAIKIKFCFIKNDCFIKGWGGGGSP